MFNKNKFSICFKEKENYSDWRESGILTAPALSVSGIICLRTIYFTFNNTSCYCRACLLSFVIQFVWLDHFHPVGVTVALVKPCSVSTGSWLIWSEHLIIPNSQREGIKRLPKGSTLTSSSHFKICSSNIVLFPVFCKYNDIYQVKIYILKFIHDLALC